MKKELYFNFKWHAAWLLLPAMICMPQKMMAENGHHFSGTWSKAVDGQKSMSCTDADCAATLYSYDVPEGEPALAIKIEGDILLTYPQSVNPKYALDGENSKITFDKGTCAVPASWIKNVYTEWTHKMQVTQAEDKSWSNACQVENCSEKEGHWVVINDKNVDLLDEEGSTGLKIANLELSDADGYKCEAEYTAATASYKRTNINNEWGTLCLPFAVKLTQDESQNFRAFTLLNAKEDVLELKELETEIPAGSPVIIKLNEGVTELAITAKGETVSPGIKSATASENDQYQLVGLYQKKEFSKDTDNNAFILKGNKLMNPAKLLENTSTTKVGSNPFRSYVVENAQTTQSAKMFSLSIGGGSTGIEQLGSLSDAKAEYYDMQGRRIKNLQKGINIVKRGNKTLKIIIK